MGGCEPRCCVHYPCRALGCPNTSADPMPSASPANMGGGNQRQSSAHPDASDPSPSAPTASLLPAGDVPEHQPFLNPVEASQPTGTGTENQQFLQPQVGEIPLPWEGLYVGGRQGGFPRRDRSRNHFSYPYDHFRTVPHRANRDRWHGRGVFPFDYDSNYIPRRSERVPWHVNDLHPFNEESDYISHRPQRGRFDDDPRRSQSGRYQRHDQFHSNDYCDGIPRRSQRDRYEGRNYYPSNDNFEEIPQRSQQCPPPSAPEQPRHSSSSQPSELPTTTEQPVRPPPPLGKRVVPDQEGFIPLPMHDPYVGAWHLPEQQPHVGENPLQPRREHKPFLQLEESQPTNAETERQERPPSSAPAFVESPSEYSSQPPELPPSTQQHLPRPLPVSQMILPDQEALSCLKERPPSSAPAFVELPSKYSSQPPELPPSTQQHLPDQEVHISLPGQGPHVEACPIPLGLDIPACQLLGQQEHTRATRLEPSVENQPCLQVEGSETTNAGTENQKLCNPPSGALVSNELLLQSFSQQQELPPSIQQALPLPPPDSWVIVQDQEGPTSMPTHDSFVETCPPTQLAQVGASAPQPSAEHQSHLQVEGSQPTNAGSESQQCPPSSAPVFVELLPQTSSEPPELPPQQPLPSPPPVSKMVVPDQEGPPAELAHGGSSAHQPIVENQTFFQMEGSQPTNHVTENRQCPSLSSPAIVDLPPQSSTQSPVLPPPSSLSAPAIVDLPPQSSTQSPVLPPPPPDQEGPFPTPVQGPPPGGFPRRDHNRSQYSNPHDHFQITDRRSQRGQWPRLDLYPSRSNLDQIPQRSERGRYQGRNDGPSNVNFDEIPRQSLRDRYQGRYYYPSNDDFEEIPRRSQRDRYLGYDYSPRNADFEEIPQRSQRDRYLGYDYGPSNVDFEEIPRQSQRDQNQGRDYRPTDDHLNYVPMQRWNSYPEREPSSSRVHDGAGEPESTGPGTLVYGNIVIGDPSEVVIGERNRGGRRTGGRITGNRVVP